MIPQQAEWVVCKNGGILECGEQSPLSMRPKYTVIFLRLAINAASCLAKGDAECGQEVLEVAAAKLLPLFEGRADGIAEDYRKEREAWDLYYDLLGKQADEALLEEAAKIVSRCRITFV